MPTKRTSIAPKTSKMRSLRSASILVIPAPAQDHDGVGDVEVAGRVGILIGAENVQLKPAPQAERSRPDRVSRWPR